MCLNWCKKAKKIIYVLDENDWTELCLEMFTLMFIKILIIKKNSNHPEYLHNRENYLVITNDYNQKSNQNFYCLLNLNWTELIPIPNKKTFTVAKALLDKWILRHGFYEQVGRPTCTNCLFQFFSDPIITGAKLFRFIAEFE